jgi:hypothetical protein
VRGKTEPGNLKIAVIQMMTAKTMKRNEEIQYTLEDIGKEFEDGLKVGQGEEVS